jgi:putative ABC transport system permease protein
MGMMLRLAWRNIWRHPRRTSLTLAAIVFSDALLVWMIGLQLGQYDVMIEYALRGFTGNVQVQAKGYKENPQIYRTIPDVAALAARIRTDTGNQDIAARGMGFALVSSKTRTYGAQIIGVQPEFEGKVSTIPGLVKQGHYLTGERAQEAVVGSVMARNLNIKLGDELTVLGSGKDGSFAATVLPVVGIFTSGNVDMDRYFVEIPIKTFQDVFSMGSDGHVIAAAGVPAGQTPRLQAEIRRVIGDDKLVVLDWEQLIPGLKQAIQADFSTAWIMYAVLVALVAFSVLNTFLMSVLERTREFGIMLALGLTPARVGRLVLLESTVMAVTGFILGAVVGLLLTLYFHVYGFSYPGLEEIAAELNMPSVIYPLINLTSVTLGPAIILIATILAALYPAARLRRLRPVEAMETV